MSKTIKLNESSFKKLLEYVGDEEALGRYDLSNNPYIPGEEKDRIVTQKSTKTIFDKDNSELDEPEYMGQDINDPGPYSLYKRMN
jgi:hypothetical protein